MKITSLPSPNFNARPDEPVCLLVMHYTGMPTAGDAIARLLDPAAEVSAHYVVNEDGAVSQLVEESRRAWHAGKSHWRGRENLNDVSIGIEIVNPGHEFGYRPFPEVQIAAVLELSLGILARHPAITPRNVVAHSDIAPERKEDPGELFPWEYLAAQGVGAWPEKTTSLQEMLSFKPVQLGSKGEQVERLHHQLSAYGYATPENEVFEIATQKIVTAFQRHFYPARLDGVWDKDCQQALDLLLEIS